MQFQKDIKDSISMIAPTIPDEKGIRKEKGYKDCIKSKGNLFSVAMADEWIKMKKFGSVEFSNGFSYGIAYSIILECYEEAHRSKSAN